MKVCPCQVYKRIRHGRMARMKNQSSTVSARHRKPDHAYIKSVADARPTTTAQIVHEMVELHKKSREK